MAGPTLAQHPGGAAMNPGYWVQGQWRGYNPQQRRQADAQAAGATAATPSDQGVAQASFQEPIPEPIGQPQFFEGELPHSECADGGPACPMPVACPVSRYWASAEYLAWWTSSMPIPALVTTSPEGTGQNEAGVIGFPTTTILFGSQGVTADGRSGARIALGRWLDPCQCRGVEVSYMTLGRQRESFVASQNEFAVLARPFFNVAGELEDPRLVAYEDSRLIVYPNVIEGTVGVTATTELQGLEVSLKRCLAQCGGSRTDFLVGYRWAELKDELLIAESTLALAGPSPGTTIDLFDQFDTKNSFHGGQLGVIHQRPISQCWSIELIGKIALGSSRSTVGINGQTTTTDPDGTADVRTGGLLTQASNIGTYRRNSFAAITELGAEVRRRIGRNLEANFGYTLFYWSDVGRAGDQVDRELNLTQVPPSTLVGAPRPHFRLHTTDFWAQGIHAGLEYRF